MKTKLARGLSLPIKRLADWLDIELAEPLHARHYETVAEMLARSFDEEASVGEGDFDLVGRKELAILVMEGLQPEHRLLDMGCGSGRLAVHAVAFLGAGSYIGTDISPSMLAAAERRVAQQLPGSSCSVSWRMQPAGCFTVADASVNLLCAFSVFTHMEAEDTFRYLHAARRIMKPEGKLVLSCLPLRLPTARMVFLRQAEIPLAERWRNVRNVTTSVEQMEGIAELAGWQVLRWYPGDERCIRLPDSEQLVDLGESVCVLTVR
jgi:ubiquinone/menaquinone biosynthesis C-methylase UbiE